MHFHWVIVVMIVFMGDIANAKQTGTVRLSPTAHAISSVWFRRSVELSHEVGGTRDPSTTIVPFVPVTPSVQWITWSARVTPYVLSISPTRGRTAVLEGVFPSAQEGTKPLPTLPCLVTSYSRTLTPTADKNSVAKEPVTTTPVQERVSSSVSQATTTTTTTTMVNSMTTAKQQNIAQSPLSKTTDLISRISVSVSPALKTLSSKNEECSGLRRATTYVNLLFCKYLMTSSIVPFSSSVKMTRDLTVTSLTTQEMPDQANTYNSASSPSAKMLSSSGMPSSNGNLSTPIIQTTHSRKPTKTPSIPPLQLSTKARRTPTTVMEHNADPLTLVPRSFTENESSHEMILPTRVLITVNTTLLNTTAQGGCLSNPCHHGGTCVPSSHDTGHNVCHCTSNWEGLTCLQDVNECLQPEISCPLFSSCQNRFGSFTCHCPLGFKSAGREGCTPGKTFLGDIMMTVQYLKEMDDTSSKEFAETEKQILAILNESLSRFAFGYKESVVVKLQQVKRNEHKNLLPGRLVALVTNTFKIDANVTEGTVTTAVDRFIHNCDIRYSSECHFAQNKKLIYSRRDICELNVCDIQSSTCINNEGFISCTCLPGFYKHHSLDRACRACENGFILQNGECVQCSFGFSGHGCREPYLLSSILLAASAGLLLLIFTVALGVICKRKRRVDLRRSHFNHEAFQLSPYSELPDIPRSSWLREENEIHDNSSTHSLLRSEESYISPAYRSSLKTMEDIESYTILPGVQCDIFGGRQNLSYTFDENRRSEYF